MSSLRDIIALGEGFTTEFKQSGTSHLGRELCAFANSTGGVILIGVSDSGEIVGVSDINKLKSEVQNIARSIEPPLVVEIDSVENVLLVSVPPQNSKPYSSGGKFYLRDGATSQRMSRNEIREFFFKEGVIHFDEMANEWFDMKADLADERFNRFARHAGLPAGMNKIQTLENLHLVRNGRMTNAGAWLLADDILKFNSAANVSCALFMGSTKTRILDRKDFNGDVYSIYQAVIGYLLEKLNTELIIKARGRDERLELPEEALREAVVNALAHRDYRSTANVQIYIFQDRVEIVSPGGLPAGMTPELLGKKSIPRNPLLFGMLYRMNAVEHVGSGIKRIRDICRNYGFEEPRIEVENDWITLSFLRPQLKDGVRVKEVTPQVTLQAPDKYPTSTRQVLVTLDSSGLELSRSALQKAANFRNREHFVNEHLRPMLAAGLIEMTLPTKPKSSSQKYRLTAKGRAFLEKVDK